MKQIRVLKDSFIIAFAMYSRIPMPKADWREEALEKALVFFPLVGAVIGCLVLLWSRAAAWLGVGTLLRTGVFLALPLLITGGIHLDGYLDTCDAISSYQSREKKLEILKDPHIGAFALIGAVIYYLLALGIWSEVQSEQMGLIACGFLLSRAYSGLSVSVLPKAKKDGLAAVFSAKGARQKRVSAWIFAAYIVVLGVIMAWQNPVIGAVMWGGAGIWFLIYRCMANRIFGGVTGDLAGFYLQICELLMAAAAVAGGFL